MKVRPVTIAGDVVLVPLTRGHVALVDAQDMALVSEFNWYVSVLGYARRKYRAEDGTQKTIEMQRAILEAPAGFFVDHINRNPLDNRRHNLRLASNSQNQANSRKRGDCSSNLKGVAWNKSVGKWQAQIKIEGRSTYLGVFSDEAAAHAAYCEAASRLFGDFARTA